MKEESGAEQRTVQEEACLIHTLRFASAFLGVLGLCVRACLLCRGCLLVMLCVIHYFSPHSLDAPPWSWLAGFEVEMNV